MKTLDPCFRRDDGKAGEDAALAMKAAEAFICLSFENQAALSLRFGSDFGFPDQINHEQRSETRRAACMDARRFRTEPWVSRCGLRAIGSRTGERPRRWRGPDFDYEAGKGESENRDSVAVRECALSGKGVFFGSFLLSLSKKNELARERESV